MAFFQKKTRAHTPAANASASVDSDSAAFISAAMFRRRSTNERFRPTENPISNYFDILGFPFSY
jgi:hypothetical protein